MDIKKDGPHIQLQLSTGEAHKLRNEVKFALHTLERSGNNGGPNLHELLFGLESELLKSSIG